MMPTLPMMTPTPYADASRKVTAPGGYEWWRFDASSDDGKLHLIAALHFGHALDPRYVRRYALYRRFPTRFRPPVPAEYCAVTFALLEKGRPALRFAEPAAAEDFSAAEDGSRVRLGASHVNRGADGVLGVHLRGTYHDRTIAVNLTFRPQLETNFEVDLGLRGETGVDDESRCETASDDRGRPAGAETRAKQESQDATTPERTPIDLLEDAAPAADGAASSSDKSTSAPAPGSPTAASLMSSSSSASYPAGRHGWVVVNPLCDVDGEISLFESESGGPPRVTPFAGTGCHDHSFGTRPMGELGARWLIGRAVFEDYATVFQQVGDATFVCRAGTTQGAPSLSDDAPLKVVGSATSRWGIGYPESVELPGRGHVRLLRPRVLGSTPATVTVAYDAVGELETGRALLQVIKPRRLLWAPR